MGGWDSGRKNNSEELKWRLLFLVDNQASILVDGVFKEGVGG